MDAATYTTGQAAQKLGVSVDTLLRWDREGRRELDRTPAGHRRYTDEDIEALRNFSADSAV